MTPPAEPGLYVWPTEERPPDIVIDDPGSAPVLYLKASTSLVPLPAISTNRAIVMASDFADSAAMFAAYPNADDYLLIVAGGGNFMSWGEILVSGRSGTAGRYRTIRFFSIADDWLHPSQRVGGNEVLVEGVRFANNSAYWIVYGLTQRGHSLGENDVQSGAHHIVFSDLLIENTRRHYGTRQRAGNDCVTQRCLMRAPAAGFGAIGINPEPDGGAMTGWKALDNEILDYIDGLLQGRSSVDPFIDISGLSEGNEYRSTGARYLSGGLSETENGMDFKGGSSLVTTVSRRDVIRGMRPRTGGAEGDALEIHRQARNLRFEQLFVDDCVFVFHETNWDSPTDPNTPRNVEFTNSQFTRIRNSASPAGGGSCFRHTNNTNVNNCWIADSDYIEYIYSTLRAGGPVFNTNTRIATEILHPSSLSQSYIANNNAVGDPALQRQYIECGRFSGRHFVRGAKTGAVSNVRDPVAAFSYSLSVATVTVTGGSSAPDGTITARSYDWGDGTAASTSENPSHVYAANGIYTITLTVTDSNGGTAKTQRNVWVTALPGPLMPRHQSTGLVLETTAGGTPGAPAGVVEHDVLVCVTVSQGTEPVTALNAHGFVQLAGSPIDVGLASGSVLGLWWKRVGAGESAVDWAPELNDPGNHLLAFVMRFDRMKRTGTPINVLNTNILTSSSTEARITGGATSADNSRILSLCTTGADSDDPQFSGMTSTSPALANFAVLVNEATSQGNGSGVVVVTGERAMVAAGAFGDMVGTLASTFRQARATLELLGELP